MYSHASTNPDSSPFEFMSDEHKFKWKGLFTTPLQKVQKEVHLHLTAKDDALEYIENLILQLLQMLCGSQPHTVQDVEDRVQKSFPHPIDKWAIGSAQNVLDKGKKKSQLVIPVDKIHPLIKDLLGYRVDHQVTVYIVAVLEYIAADILKLTGNYVKNIKHQEITVQDIKVAMCADKVLMDMFFQDEDDEWTPVEAAVCHNTTCNSYEDEVKDLVLEENQYMRDLNMIIRVFREPFTELFPGSKDIKTIFSNIVDVHDLAYNLLSSVEDTLEANEDSGVPLIGACFEDIAEGAEFLEYFEYAEDILGPNGKDRLNTLLRRADVTNKFQSAGHGFKDVVKYLLPKLLLGPIFHCLHYFDVMQNLKKTSTDEEDQESLKNAYILMHHIKTGIEKKLNTASLSKRKPGEFLPLRFQGQAEKEVALNKMNEVQKQIDNWEGKNIGQSCHEFIMEGTLLQKYDRRRLAERYVFLFDGLLIFTKQNLKGRSSVTGSTAEFKLKEKFNMRKVDVSDREDTEELKNSFDVLIRDRPNVILVAKSAEDKSNWMAALLSLLRRSMLERMLDAKLSDEARQQPIRLPKQYKFSEEDSEENIVFEDHHEPSTDSPLIKGGTLVKLVERLTYHMYAEPKFVRTFLTTYRTFCKPIELLELLIERFSIPEPAVSIDGEKSDENVICMSRDDIKRFKKEYAKPVQFRVVNVLRHWVDQHWCDFDWNRDLLQKLSDFLDSIKGKAMRKWVESSKKIINRKLESDGTEVPKTITFPHDKPAIEWHIAKCPDEFDLMKLHPIEIARQVTLLEFDLYRAVKPSEMVGTVWMKKKKSVTSPNLLKTINHSTRFTFWLEKCIIETECFEERVLVLCRILEIMMVFQELNNFNGVLEVVAALNSSPVHRLEHTFEEVDKKHHKLMKAFDEAKELNSDHFKKYYEKLRSINPPCVPFLGNYLTNILLTEEGNPDFLPNCPEGIINFSKRRKVAAICGEIQQYQNQPYCLEKEPEIRSYFESLSPFGELSEKEFNDSLYEKSLIIEPRNAKQPAKYDKKFAFSLKSPGIKPSNYNTLKHGSVSLNSTSTLQRLHDTESAIGLTPPTTPNTPLTPPPDSACDTNSTVFSMVHLPHFDTMSVGGTSLSSGISSLTMNSHISHSTSKSEPVPMPQPPPPLPPRRKPSSGCELSPVSTVAPALPAKASKEAEPPPPLPPRPVRERGGSLVTEKFVHNLHQQHLHQHHPGPGGHMTLPRYRIPYHPGAQTTLPRRNSERDYSSQPPQFVNVNGERGGSVTPELPPKTYRSVSHSRQQSS